ncbi:MAG: hypothetical protein J6J09_10560, partial [Phocaeicola sp.]|nr:hypothetical protein [Phocaeicola sp.]
RLASLGKHALIFSFFAISRRVYYMNLSCIRQNSSKLDSALIGMRFLLWFGFFFARTKKK